MQQPEKEPKETIIKRLRPWWFIIAIALFLLSLGIFRVAAGYHFKKTVDQLRTDGWLSAGKELQHVPKASVGHSNPKEIYAPIFEKMTDTGVITDPFDSNSGWSHKSSSRSHSPPSFRSWLRAISDDRPALDWDELLAPARVTVNQNTESLALLRDTADLEFSKWPSAGTHNSSNLEDAINLLGTALIIQSNDHKSLQFETTCNAMLRAASYHRSPLRCYRYILTFIEIALMHHTPNPQVLSALDAELADLEPRIQPLGAAIARRKLATFISKYQARPEYYFGSFMYFGRIVNPTLLGPTCSISGIRDLDAANVARRTAAELNVWESSFPNWQEFSLAHTQASRKAKASTPSYYFMMTSGTAYLSAFAISSIAAKVRALRNCLAILRQMDPLPSNIDGSSCTMGSLNNWTTTTVEVRPLPETVHFLNPTSTADQQQSQ